MRGLEETVFARATQETTKKRANLSILKTENALIVEKNNLKYNKDKMKVTSVCIIFSISVKKLLLLKTSLILNGMHKYAK